jgi:hypothetical protein
MTSWHHATIEIPAQLVEDIRNHGGKTVRSLHQTKTSGNIIRKKRVFTSQTKTSDLFNVRKALEC